MQMYIFEIIAMMLFICALQYWMLMEISFDADGQTHLEMNVVVSASTSQLHSMRYMC